MKNCFVFSDYELSSDLIMKNRIVMAPMSRQCVDGDFSPHEKMISYYAERAEVGLIITEAVAIDDNALSDYPAPGIFTDSHICRWHKIVSSVHENRGLIFAQLWHPGRVLPLSANKDKVGVSASETKMTNLKNKEGATYDRISRAATQSEINDILEQYVNAAMNSIKAGFNGIEIHAGNGYLIDQFLHYGTNKRSDHYGGNPRNMSRFALSIIEACGKSIGYERIGIRLSPGCYTNQIMPDSRDHETFTYLLNQLNQLPVAYVHTANKDDEVTFDELNGMTMTGFIRKHYRGTLIACGGYDLPKAEHGIAKGEFDLVAMGRPFINNADLLYRLRHKLPF